MELLHTGKETYFEFNQTESEHFDAWLDAVIVAANPEEVTDETALLFIENEENTRANTHGSVCAYFAKKLMPEFSDHAELSDSMVIEETTFRANTEKGIFFRKEPTELAPGQYYPSYVILLNDLTETRPRYSGSLSIYIVRDRNGLDSLELNVNRGISKGYGDGMFYDGFTYERVAGSQRLLVKHHCFTQDIEKSILIYHPLTGERATFDSLDGQMLTISKVLGIAVPELLSE